MGLKNSYYEIDALVVGAGPAGTVAALNLAATRKVILIDLRSEPSARIGESLPPAARRLFADMGLWESFRSQGHSPCYGNRALWGTSKTFETDFLRDPDGHGWHIDRARFERWLRQIATDRGATLLAPARLKSIVRIGKNWQALINTPAGDVEAFTDLLIDAGGCTSPLARHVGARREVQDRLVCGWLYGAANARGRNAGFTYVQAAEDGWWYTAPLPDGRRVLAFHTDADLPAAHDTRNAKALLERAAACPELGSVLAESNFLPSPQFGFTAAHSAVLQPAAGHTWFAVGDAAMSFDPLSAQGLLTAMFTGLAGAEAADRYLSGDENAPPEYSQTVRQLYQKYREQLRYWYRTEARWRDSPFWKRRN
jgi:flavin-dependent dehydrogenase